MKTLCMALAASLVFVATSVRAGPDDPSHFDSTRYQAQKAMYDFNFASPDDTGPAFNYVLNHLQAIKDYGDPRHSHLVIVAHGNELHALSRLNRAAYPDMYERLKALKDAGVTIHICANAARSRGYAPEDFYDVTTVVPAAVIDIAKWQNEGYSYMFAGWYPRPTREDVVKANPVLR